MYVSRVVGHPHVRHAHPLARSLVSDASFPRKQALEHVLHVIRTQPRLSKDASSLLIDLGEAIQANAVRDEVGVLVGGTLLQETHVRNSCLMAIQVRQSFSRVAPTDTGLTCARTSPLI